MSMVEDRDAVPGTRVAGRGARCAGTAIGLCLALTSVSCSGESAGDANRTPSRAANRDSSNAAHRASALSPSGTRPERRTILFAGTSITAGLGLEPDSAYPHLIDRKLDSLRLPYDVVNAGVSGETSAGLLRRIDWLLREPFDVVVVETGANDGLRGAPVATVRANIQQIIDRIKAARPEAEILLVQMEALPNFGERYTSDFRAMFPDLARRNGVTLLPFLLEGVAGHRDLNQADGIHPNMAGERVVAENIWRALRPHLERRLQERPLSSQP
jgi:acyl-CoA thioesterase-1